MKETEKIDFPDIVSVMIARRFGYRSPTPDQIKCLESVRTIIIRASVDVYKTCTDCEEKKIALTKLEECLLWMTQAILRH